jgi:hypothetical protein
MAKEKCLPQIVFPFSSDGGKRPRGQDETNCLWKDAGCGYNCLDELATELGLLMGKMMMMTMMGRKIHEWLASSRFFVFLVHNNNSSRSKSLADHSDPGL